MKAFPSRAAMFIRALASDIAPMNRIESVLHDVQSMDWTPEDFTERERHLARTLAPSTAELDAMLAERGQDLRAEVERYRKECEAQAAYVRAQDLTYQGMRSEVHALKKLLEEKDR